MSQTCIRRVSSKPGCFGCRNVLLSVATIVRSFTTTFRQRANGDLDEIGRMMIRAPPPQSPQSAGGFNIPSNTQQTVSQSGPIFTTPKEPHHLHIYATKHNTHITLTKPNRDALMSMAAGNIGFRKAARGSYDAAYQLAAFVLGQIQEKGLLSEIRHIEVVLRGFGAGREAVTKILLGSEGRKVRDKIVKVTDATRLKFGGTRSPKPRRLG